MDGTLVLGDTLHESLLAMLRRQPLMLLLLPVWLLRGKAHFKREVARRAMIDADALVYHEPLLSWLREQRGSREIVLCTAADAGIAEAVATHTGAFDAVLASDGIRNLAGSEKAAALTERYGPQGFDYAGNDAIDLPVWSAARHAIVVNASPGIEQALREQAQLDRVFPRERHGFLAWMQALRLHQWAKNLLIFVPLLTAHLAFERALVVQALLAFLAFGLCASSVYVLNDLIDLPSDRRHPRKRFRPFASGRLPLSAGFLLAPALLVSAFALATLLPDRFVGVLTGYYALTLAYTLWLKRVEMLDVVVLAALYTARLIAGGAATGIPLSFWLLAFSMFLFLSLALVKRYTELMIMRAGGETAAAGRGYHVNDMPLLGALGSAAGFLAVLVLALYVNSTDSQRLYEQPKLLWLLCPLLLYWIGRAWLLTFRGRMHDDPLMFAIRDPVSLSILVGGALVVWLAI